MCPWLDAPPESWIWIFCKHYVSQHIRQACSRGNVYTHNKRRPLNGVFYAARVVLNIQYVMKKVIISPQNYLFLFKTTFRRLDSASSTSSVVPIKLVCASRPIPKRSIILLICHRQEILNLKIGLLWLRQMFSSEYLRRLGLREWRIL
jgi:hypothetical protein